MHEFKFLKNRLYCEKVAVAAIARSFGTPLYLYSYKTLIDHYAKLKKAFSEIVPLICYSIKANSNLAILKALVDKGCGLDVVSGGELYRAIKAGCLPKKIVYASVGKTDSEIEEAIKIGILFFNVESISELVNINRIAGRLKKRASIAVRINPDVEPKTHKFITTGKLTNKFGIDFATAQKILACSKNFLNTDIRGLHIHIGSQITESSPFVNAIIKVIKFIQNLKKEGINFEYLNIGGGLGIVYNKKIPQTADEFARKVIPLLKKSGLKIILEPGRFIAGPSGILVVKVLYIKTTPLKNFIIVDGGMNDLIRPALYGAYHEILPVTSNQKLCLARLAAKRAGLASRAKRTGRQAATRRFDIAGSICESGDFFAKDRVLPEVKEGDYLAIMGAGAYGFSMASNYNSRCRPAEVIVKDNKAYVIRKRESYKDLVRNEIMPWR